MLPCIAARLRAEAEWKVTNGVHDLDVPPSGVLVELNYRRSDFDRTAIPSLSAAAITACMAGEFVPGAQHCVADFARAIISNQRERSYWRLRNYYYSETTSA